ncbi:MAG: acylphosphatase [Flavobacteriales bacterium]|nr:acylphosphatase [Flavobacteriales bacterium]
MNEPNGQRLRGYLNALMKAVEWIVLGRVQGVGYREAARRKAIELQLTGTVQNQPDGTVLIQVQGTVDPLHTFQVWCRRGPWFAQVEKVTEREIPSLLTTTFDVVR